MESYSNNEVAKVVSLGLEILIAWQDFLKLRWKFTMQKNVAVFLLTCTFIVNQISS